MVLYDGMPSHVKTDIHGNRYILMVQKQDFFAPLTRLEGYALSGLEIDLSAPIDIPRFIVQNGQQFAIMDTVRGQAARKYTWTIGFPAGNFIMTPLGRLTEDLNTCRRDYFLYYGCPTDDCLSHFWGLADGLLGQQTPGDLIVLDGDAEPVTSEAQLTPSRPYIYFFIRGAIAYSAGEPLYSVAFCEEVCTACAEPNSKVVFGGEDTSDEDAPTLFRTDNQFLTVQDIAPTAPAAGAITGLICQGETIVATWADDPNIVTATTGGLLLSKNGGDDYTAGVDIATGLAVAVAFADTFVANGYYWAIGQAGAIWRSIDGANWEELVNNVSAATTHLHKGAYDAEKSLIYIAGQDTVGPTGVALVITDNIIVDISSIVNAGAVPIRSVAVLKKDHVAFGLDNGTLREHADAANASSTNLYRTVVTGASDPVVAVDGDPRRTVIWAGTEARERSVLTQRDFAPIRLISGTTVTGDFTDGKSGSTGGTFLQSRNYFIGVTDAGEVVFYKPCYVFAGQ